MDRKTKRRSPGGGDGAELDQLAKQVDRVDTARPARMQASNRCRLKPSEVVARMHAMLPAARAEAKMRQAHGRTAPGRRLQPKGNHQRAMRVLDQIAAQLGVSHTTLRHAAAVVAAAAADPVKYGPLVGQMDRTGKVDPVYRALCGKRRKRRRCARCEWYRRQLRKILAIRKRRDRKK